MRPKIMITGPQGSGKSTQSEALAKYLGVPVIDVGAMLRRLAGEKSLEGSQVKATLSKGMLAPNGIVGRLVKARIEREDCNLGFVVDGYPRTRAQLEIFDPEYKVVFYLSISDSEAIRRLGIRNRADDRSELIKERLEWYHQQTELVLEHYRSLGILHQIDGEKSIDEIQSEIRKVVDETKE